MPILEGFQLPPSVKELSFDGSTFFIAFVSTKDPKTEQAWCPDVRAAEPHIIHAFSSNQAPCLAIVEIELAEWCSPENVFRTIWGTRNIPALVRYEYENGEVVEEERLVEGDIRPQKLSAFLARDGSQ